MRNLENIEVKIVPRISFEGHPFSELLHTWTEGGKPRHACSRTWWVQDDTPHGRAAAIAAFKKRQGA